MSDEGWLGDKQKKDDTKDGQDDRRSVDRVWELALDKLSVGFGFLKPSKVVLDVIRVS